MAFPKAQHPLDWLTQLWNICLGEKVNSDSTWLIGPIGPIGGIRDTYIETLADRENLEVSRNGDGFWLVDNFKGFSFEEEQVHPLVRDFYQHTIDYDLDVWTQWKPIFGSFGFLVRNLFSRRIEQLSLPQHALETARGMISEIIYLRNADDDVVYRIWFRRLQQSGEVVYSGIYSHCILPSGEKCLKIIFPLPQGSATVMLKLEVTPEGHLELISKGRRSGDPGFYFLVEDRKETLWQHYLPSFQERIFVYVDEAGELRADHSMSLWGHRAYELHYRMREKVK